MRMISIVTAVVTIQFQFKFELSVQGSMEAVLLDVGVHEEVEQLRILELRLDKSQ